MVGRRFVLCGTLLLGGGVWVGAALSPHAAAAKSLSPEDAAVLRRDLAASVRPLVDGGDALAKIARLAGPSVVHIESNYRTRSGSDVEETGSGAIVRHPDHPGDYVLTNRHVVIGGEVGDVTVQLADGRHLTPTRLWEDPQTDIAILRIPDTGLPAIRFGDSDRIEPGHFVMALGSPFGLSRSVTLGIVSATGRRHLDLDGSGLLNQDFIQTDAAINPGNSGGPLVDLFGRLVGVNTAIASQGGGNEGIAFAVPSKLAERVFDELLEYSRVRRAYLGVKLDPQYDSDAARRLGLDRLYGAHVLFVHSNTPADDAGLRANDVVLTFGSVEVQDENHLINLVSLTPVGERVLLRVQRDGRVRTIPVDLVPRPERRVEPVSDRARRRESLYRPNSLSRGTASRGTAAARRGPTVRTLHPALAHAAGLPARTAGVLVTDPGDIEGLRAGDAVVAVNAVPVADVGAFDAATGVTGPRLLRVVNDGAERLVIWE